MRTAVKLLLILLAGYVAAAVTGSAVWALASFGSLSIGALFYTAWFSIMFLFAGSFHAIALHVVLLGLAMATIRLRRLVAWKHVGATAAVSAVVGGTLGWRLAAQDSSFSFLLALGVLPLATAGSVMAGCARVLFEPQDPAHAVSIDPLQAAARQRRISTVTAILLIPAVLATTAWLSYLYRERHAWNRTQERLRRVVMVDERFPYVRVDRARNGSVFLFGTVESQAALRDLYTAVEEAKLERTPDVVVTVSHQAIMSRSTVVRTPAR